MLQEETGQVMSVMVAQEAAFEIGISIHVNSRSSHAFLAQHHGVPTSIVRVSATKEYPVNASRLCDVGRQ